MSEQDGFLIVIGVAVGFNTATLFMISQALWKIEAALKSRVAKS